MVPHEPSSDDPRPRKRSRPTVWELTNLIANLARIVIDLIAR